MFELRPYQGQILNDVRDEMLRGTRAIVAQAPTGSGKTALAVKMLGTAAQRGMGGLFLVHRRELVKQTIKAFDRVGVDYGIIASGFEPDRKAKIQIASVQTYRRRWQNFERPKLVVWDECHHVAAGTWSGIFKGIASAFHVGLSATPERLDGAGLSEYFKAMVNGPSTRHLIEEGWLCPYRLYAPPGVSVSGLHTRMGDYVKSELSSAVDKPTVTGDAIREYKRRCEGGRAVVFCVSIEHSKHVVAQFQAAGIAAAHVDGETPHDERDETLAALERGSIRVVSNVELFGEGFDLPAIDCVIGLRPTQSLALVLQQWGRALRPVYGIGDTSTKEGRIASIKNSPKPYAILLDHAGNCQRHGLPDDDRTWSLAGMSGKARGASGESAPVKTCKACAAVMPRAATYCKICGQQFGAQGPDVQFVAGDLEEIDSNQIHENRRREQSEANTLEKLVSLGRKNGYKDPRRWAEHVHNARLRKARQGQLSFHGI
jgi:superfamily II DNA or RNA helicase